MQHTQCLPCLQTFWAKSIEDRAKVDLKLHFMKKTLNEVVSMFFELPAAAQSRFDTQTEMYDSETRYVSMLAHTNRLLELQWPTQVPRKLHYRENLSKNAPLGEQAAQRFSTAQRSTDLPLLGNTWGLQGPCASPFVLAMI